jgi:hypothetical protein
MIEVKHIKTKNDAIILDETCWVNDYDDWEEYPFGIMPRRQPPHGIDSRGKKYPTPTYDTKGVVRCYSQQFDRALWYYAKRFLIKKLVPGDFFILGATHEGVVDGDWGSS